MRVTKDVAEQLALAFLDETRDQPRIFVPV